VFKKKYAAQQLMVMQEGDAARKHRLILSCRVHDIEANQASPYSNNPPCLRPAAPWARWHEPSNLSLHAPFMVKLARKPE
jgi:hypothetical protein